MEESSVQLFFNASDFASLWSKTDESQLTKGKICLHSSVIQPRYFSFSQLSNNQLGTILQCSL
jgi:hypothetical protein